MTPGKVTSWETLGAVSGAREKSKQARTKSPPTAPGSPRMGKYIKHNTSTQEYFSSKENRFFSEKNCNKYVKKIWQLQGGAKIFNFNFQL